MPRSRSRPWPAALATAPGADPSGRSRTTAIAPDSGLAYLWLTAMEAGTMAKDKNKKDDKTKKPKKDKKAKRDAKG